MKIPNHEWIFASQLWTCWLETGDCVGQVSGKFTEDGNYSFVATLSEPFGCTDSEWAELIDAKSSILESITLESLQKCAEDEVKWACEFGTRDDAIEVNEKWEKILE